MKLNSDDPRLTAYALSELDDTERKAIEAELNNSDEHRREVEAIRHTCELLGAEMAAEPLPELTYAQQLAIEEQLKPEVTWSKVSRSEASSRWLRWIGLTASAVAAVFCIWMIVSSFSGSGPGGRSALAQTWAQIQKAKFITWKETQYFVASSKEGETWWLPQESQQLTHQFAYKAPGIYRQEHRDTNGQVAYVKIEDDSAWRILTLLPDKKEAVLSGITYPKGELGGPFASLIKFLGGNDLQWVEARKLAGREVNLFRHAMKAKDNANGVPWSCDFWIDSKTKQLVEIHVPGADIFNPETDPARNHPAGKFWRGRSAGLVVSEFNCDADLDESLFSLKPPAGYALRTEAGPLLTERVMLDFLGVLAEYNDRTFPEDTELGGVFNDRREKKSFEKPEAERTAMEKKFVETYDRYSKNGFNDPIGLFLYRSVAEKSFRYLGKGIAFGDKDRVVCWYRLKAANSFRVVYGDLSVKDVSPDALPLPVEK